MKYVPLHHPYFQDDHPPVLDEMHFQEIMHKIDPFDLPYENYEPLVKFVRYVGTEGDTMKFYVPSPLKRDDYKKYLKFINKPVENLWTTQVSFVEWNQMVADRSVNATEAARLLLWGGNLLFHCDCPAYLFWGFQYIDTLYGIAKEPLDIEPNIRNPHLKGIVCKHGIKTMKVLGFHLGDMAAAIKFQRENGSGLTAS